MVQGAAVFGGRGDGMVNAMRLGVVVQNQVEVLRARCAALEEFPEVAEKFNIKEKGMQAALNALTSVKAGTLGAGSSAAGENPHKM